MHRLILLALLCAAPTLVLCAGSTFAQSRDAAPPVGFDAEAPPLPEPDYTDATAWAARPGQPGVAAQVPPGVAPPPATPPADIFYIHPTTYRSARWNQAIEDDQVNAWTDVSTVARQASIFNGCCRVFAPRYRQASGRAFAEMAGDGMKAYRFAYGDVARAFDHYLKHDNKGRPFLLVGHSQGALQAMFLLRDRIDGTPLQRQLVAAYVIGIGVPVGALRDIKPCEQPDATGCILSWNAFQEGSDISGWVKRSVAGYTGSDATLVCSNPLRFGSPAALAAANLGALPGRVVAGPLPPLLRHATGARCSGGALFVSPDPALGSKPLPGGVFHLEDMALFYANIRANALVRVRTWKKEHQR